jgi:protein SCO1/2
MLRASTLERGMVRRFTALLALAALAAAPARAQRSELTVEQRFDPAREIGFDQRLGAQVPLDLAFRDESGRTLRLSELFGERPVVIALVYYECPMLCTLVLNGMVRTFRALALDLGGDYEVVTVSIDPSETPELAAQKKAQYLETFAGGEPSASAAAGWHFLTGDQASIDALARAIGFRYAYDAQSGEYAHASGFVVATPQGQLSRYLFGVEYITRDLRLALVEASRGRVGNLIDQVLLLCYHYDPATGRYGFAIVSAVRAAGILTVALIVGFVVRSLLRERSLRTRAAHAHGGGS